MEELEIVPHQLSDGIRIFINKVEYRSPHFHPEWELLWVLDTPLSITSSQKQYLIQPGELILFPPNYPHEFHKMERPCTFLCMQVSSRITASTTNLHTEDIRLANHLSREEDFRLRKIILDTARTVWRQDPLSSLFCLGQCSLILYQLLRRLPSHVMSPEEMANAEQRNARLMRLMQFVDENYMHKIRLSDFAKQEGRSVSYLSHFVKDNMNQTFQDYVSYVRFNCARKLIAGSNKPLVSICMESGFSDYRYFSQVFRETYGMTPAEYRRQSQTGLPEQTFQNHSLHSREEIYSDRKCLQLAEEFEAQLHAE